MKVKIRVISKKGKCTENHEVGDEIIITTKGVEGKICIHALYSMLPKAFALMYGAKFPWVNEGENTVADPKTHALDILNGQKKYIIESIECAKESIRDNEVWIEKQKVKIGTMEKQVESIDNALAKL